MRRLCACGLLAIALTACATSSSATSSAPRIAPAALLASIDAGAAPVIVDVRTRGEYDRGHVPGAIHVPFYTFLVRQDEFPGPRGQPVVVYCQHGPRAGIARLALRLAGFEDVRYLEGHMSGWTERGLPIERTGP